VTPTGPPLYKYLLHVTATSPRPGVVRLSFPRPLPAGLLLQRWRRLPAVDPALLRADIDSVLDATL
jgi:hypothetical protein